MTWTVGFKFLTPSVDLGVARARLDDANRLVFSSSLGGEEALLHFVEVHSGFGHAVGVLDS